MGSVYFVSDLHLGAPNASASRKRERAFLRWIDAHRSDMDQLFVVGDLFDFWFEYKRAVPRGFVRTLGKLATLADEGVEIHFFTGNHDLWVDDYLEKEIGCKVYTEPKVFELQNKKLLVGHGDGLGPGDHGYKFLKKVFTNSFLKWCFARIHPNMGIGIANYFSKSSRAKTGEKDKDFKGIDGEWLYIYAREYQQTQEKVDYFVFGHRHLPLDVEIPEGGKYINLGDWIQYFTYGKLENAELSLNKWEG
jgi:UDP-2,3-diacylglucosamine hydrolase